MAAEKEQSVFIFGGNCPFQFWLEIPYQTLRSSKNYSQVDIVDLNGRVWHFDKEIVFKDTYDFRTNEEGNDYSNHADTLGMLTGNFFGHRFPQAIPLEYLRVMKA